MPSDPSATAATLFVYGTLRRGHPQHHLLGEARLVGAGTIPGTLYDLGHYPGVHRGHRDGRVAGELFELLGADVERRLARLDRYEGVQYRRSRVIVLLDDGRRRGAWAWVLAAAPPRDAREIPDGRWRDA